MVYSTCSFNPLEDEAVVMELLRRCNGIFHSRYLYKVIFKWNYIYTIGAVSVVDVSGQLPDLKRSQGKTSWKVKYSFTVEIRMKWN